MEKLRESKVGLVLTSRFTCCVLLVLSTNENPKV